MSFWAVVIQWIIINQVERLGEPLRRHPPFLKRNVKRRLPTAGHPISSSISSYSQLIEVVVACLATLKWDYLEPNGLGVALTLASPYPVPSLPKAQAHSHAHCWHGRNGRAFSTPKF
ncbi:hypothetical protein Naga_101435g1 [Nannochloropsis gaditana]|uniref:Uncharacterized protein n=1 Tax=Nannochloropsis gaditana TaxID=72520 RepID=W7SZ73_9STRA|nr:hypothetical protein Naga_101435g1 [Nannochloropsis gaditana]